MDIKPISYSKSFEMVTPTGLHYWEKISIGADLSPEDNVQECLEVLKVEVVKFQQKVIVENEAIGVRQVNKWTKPEISSEHQAILDGIDNSPTMDELNSYWLRSKSNLILSTAYKAKEKQLTDAK